MLSRVIAFVFAALPLLGCGGDEAVPCPVQTWSATTRCMQTARAGAAGAPEMISSSGCYADVAKHRVDDTLFPYEVASPLWTDGALKRRFIALPDGAQLSAGSSGGAWTFPAGTVLVKEFWVPARDDDARFSQARLVETRFLVKQDDDAWGGYSYQWNEDQSDARLLSEEGDAKVYAVTREGGSASHKHIFPSRKDCFWCHRSERPVPLGIRTAQLNRALGDSITRSVGAVCGDAQENQLALLVRAGLVAPSDALAQPDKLAAMATPMAADSGASVEQRARSYLDANCSFCHYGKLFPSMDLGFGVPLSQMAACNAPSYRSDIGSILLVPGDAKSSVLWLRMVSRDFLVGMPPAGTERVDQGAADLVAQWINSLEGCPAP